MNMQTISTASQIVQEQTRWTAEWHTVTPAAAADGFLRLVAENHLRNFSLWHEEDIARRDDLGDESVRKCKRAIDAYNQQRNDFVEQMDKALVESLKPRADCPFNSETPGMMIDRLSILALKEFHMREQALRPDASKEHKDKCAFRLDVIARQREDLSNALQTLLDEVKSGTRSFRVYFQFKMYNDPSMNPQLYAGRKNS